MKPSKYVFLIKSEYTGARVVIVDFAWSFNEARDNARTKYIESVMYAFGVEECRTVQEKLLDVDPLEV